MIRMIAACARNRVMGKDGTLPWNIRADWNYFLEKTQSGVLLMGRRCYEDFTGYAESRAVVVLSRNSTDPFPHAHRAGSLEEGIETASKLGDDVWICGGASIYEEAMPLAKELFLTQIDADFEGDVKFPSWHQHFAREISRKEITSDGYRLTFSVLAKQA
jgi:dihydrofolate reductase